MAGALSNEFALFLTEYVDDLIEKELSSDNLFIAIHNGDYPSLDNVLSMQKTHRNKDKYIFTVPQFSHQSRNWMNFTPWGFKTKYPTIVAGVWLGERLFSIVPCGINARSGDVVTLDFDPNDFWSMKGYDDYLNAQQKC